MFIIKDNGGCKAARCSLFRIAEVVLKLAQRVPVPQIMGHKVPDSMTSMVFGPEPSWLRQTLQVGMFEL